MTPQSLFLSLQAAQELPQDEEDVEVAAEPGQFTDPAFQEIPEGVAHLDFGVRDGGGVVGPKLDRLTGRESDKFEVKEGKYLVPGRGVGRPTSYILLSSNHLLTLAIPS